MNDPFQKLEELISNVPAVKTPFAKGNYENGFWWIKFSIDITHPLAWTVVQQLAHVINYLSISERLSTVFYPVSSPPTAKDGPEESLAWIIETTAQDFSPNELAEWLDNRLPSPVNNVEEWVRVSAG